MTTEKPDLKRAATIFPKNQRVLAQLGENISQIESGRHGSVNEVVCAGLKILEDTESKLNTLRRMLAEGEQSGLADYNCETFIAELDESGKRTHLR